MTIRNWRYAFRIITGICAVSFYILLAAGPANGSRERQISCPEDLRTELWLAQVASPPRADGVPVLADAGDFLFISQGDADGSDFTEGLVPVLGADNVMRWPVTVFEDPLTRETVFLNADGEEVGRLGMPLDYDPAWVIETVFPEGVPQEIDSADYDPSRVVLCANLLSTLPPESARTGLRAHTGPEKAEKQEAEKTERQRTSKEEGHSGADREALPGEGPEPAARTNAPGQSASRPVSRVQGRIVYVDRKCGKDTWAGRAGRATADNNGPKRTVAAGVKALRDGDQLLISDGVYGETLDVRGKRTLVRIKGDVALKGTKGDGDNGTVRAPEASSTTGTVAQAAALQKK